MKKGSEITETLFRMIDIHNKTLRDVSAKTGVSTAVLHRARTMKQDIKLHQIDKIMSAYGITWTALAWKISETQGQR